MRSRSTPPILVASIAIMGLGRAGLVGLVFQAVETIADATGCTIANSPCAGPFKAVCDANATGGGWNVAPLVSLIPLDAPVTTNNRIFQLEYFPYFVANKRFI